MDKWKFFECHRKSRREWACHSFAIPVIGIMCIKQNNKNRAHTEDEWINRGRVWHRNSVLLLVHALLSARFGLYNVVNFKGMINLYIWKTILSGFIQVFVKSRTTIIEIYSYLLLNKIVRFIDNHENIDLFCYVFVTYLH